MAKRGPKTKYTPDRVARILDLLKSGNTRGATCGAVAIDHDTLLRWIVKYPEFAESVRAAESAAEQLHVKAIADAAQKGSVAASIFWLERRRYQEWGRKDRLEVVQSVREAARSANVDEEAAVQQAELILREMRAHQRG